MPMTAEQNAAIAATWNNPSIPMDQKKAMMSQYGVGVTDIMNATGQDLNSVASAFSSGGDWGGLHFGAGGQLTGTDWAGPVAQPAPTPAPIPTPTGMTPEQNKSIAAFWEANKSNPKAIIDGMTQYGVSAQDLANAIGRNVSEVGNYLVDAGAPRGFGGFSKGITDTYYGSAAQPSQYAQAQIDAAKNPTVVVGGTPAGQTAAQSLRDPNPPIALRPPQTTPMQTGVTQATTTNTIQPGTSPGWSGLPSGQQPPSGPLGGEYQMPVLNALYQAQQQRMSAPVPRFNFQGPLTTTAVTPPATIIAGAPTPGALTTVISGA